MKMKMKITLEWLEKNNACQSGIDWYKQQGTDDFIELCKRARDAGNFNDFCWCYARRVNRKTRILWACYAAELALPIFESRYPEDNRPRAAIEAARKCAKKNKKKNRAAAHAAANAAHAAAISAANFNNNLSAYVAHIAADVANTAAYDYANVAADTASYASTRAGYAYSEKKDTQNKIMDYGIKLLNN